MAKLLTMGKLTCFPIFNKKSRVKNDSILGVDDLSCLEKSHFNETNQLNKGNKSPVPISNQDLESKDVKEDHKLTGGESSLRPLPALKQRQSSSCGSDNNFTFSPHLCKSGNGSQEIAYEGSDEEEIRPYSRDLSDNDAKRSCDDESDFSRKLEKHVCDDTQDGHVSDPGTYKPECFSSGTSPILKRSRSVSKFEASPSRRDGSTELPSNPQSYEDLQALASDRNGIQGIHSSPCSEITFRSADKVMLKKGSSSKVLSLGAQKFWWKIFLWSHRNLHKGNDARDNSESDNKDEVRKLVGTAGGYSSDILDTCRNEQKRKTDCEKSKQVVVSGGYSSDTVDLCREEQSKQPDSELFGQEIVSATQVDDTDHAGEGTSRKASKLLTRAPTYKPSNQWMAFTAEQSSMKRVQEWVSSIDTTITDIENDGNELYDNKNLKSEVVAVPTSFQIESNFQEGYIPEEVQLANNAIRSLNAFSTVAHISAIGLKVIPALAPFTSLRTVNLSGNSIVRISVGSLPKSLHVLDLSRNKISAIEGLRELTRLRVLDLSYNRITRIGHGLASCTLIKELYLAGNKISDVDGLHRLLKLTVLDLSFNKITTVKALGQLAANYSSLLALNLLGNPVHTNVGEEQLRKSVLSLLTHLTYFNKQPIKNVSAREAAIDSVARAALGNAGHRSRNKQSRRSYASSSHRSVASSSRGNQANDGASRRGRVHKSSKDKGKVKMERLSVS